MTLRVCILPRFLPTDEGDGGIRRVVEAQTKHLPAYDIEIVGDVDSADVVAIHGAASIKTTKPVVTHCHGLYWNEYNWARWAHHLNEDVIEGMRHSAAVTSVSKWVAYALARGMWLSSDVIYNGIDLGSWHSEPCETPYVLWNKTRIDPVCDPTVLDAMASRLPDVKFVSTFGERAANVKLTGRLSFDEAKNLIQKSRVYLCNTRETFGIGTLEAMASGSIPVCFAWGGQREFIRHRENGWLATPGDLDGLAEGIRWALDNYDEVSVAARATAEKFSWDEPIRQYADLYKRVWREYVAEQERPRTSVIITCYKLADTLPRAVESIISQSDKDVEVVIVNDASPDNTREVAEALAASDSRIKVVNNSTNLYLSGALDAGISASSGRYIVPLDADNTLAPNSLETLARHLDEAPNVDIAYGAMEVVNADGTRFVSSWPPHTFDYRAQMRHRNQLPSTSMYRRWVWSRSLGYRRRCRTAEDADFWCRVSSLGARAEMATEAPVFTYYNRSSSMSNTVKDWPWHEWYSWSRDYELTPFGAVLPRRTSPPIVPTYEPAMVTVIIPVGPGHEKYLPDAIDSLWSQTFQNWRCIVVNDTGGALRLPPFVDTYETPKPGSGPSVARNIGIMACTTPTFVPLDADDYLQPEALEILVKAWKAGLNAGDSKRYFYTDWYKSETREAYSTPEFSCEELRLKFPHAVTALYPTSSGALFDETLDAWEDWDYVLQLVKLGYCGERVPLPLLYYRIGSGSRREAMHGRWPELVETIKAKYPEWYGENGARDMGCGCGGASRSGAINYGSPQSVASASGTGGMVLLQFLGDGGARSYRGQASGITYRFGGDESHQRGYVYAADAIKEPFTNTLVFKVIDESITSSDVVLQAEGPPAPAPASVAAD